MNTRTLKTGTLIFSLSLSILVILCPLNVHSRMSPLILEPSAKIQNVLKKVSPELPFSEEDLEGVKETLLNRGLWSSPFHGTQILLWGEKNNINSHSINAVVNTAIQICRRCPAVLYRAGTLEIRKGGTSFIPQAMVLFINGLMASVRESFKALTAIPLLAGALSRSILLALLIISILDIFLNRRLLSHFFTDWLGMKAGGALPALIILLLSTLPLLMGFGLDITALFLAATSVLWTPSDDRKFFPLSVVLLILASLLNTIYIGGQNYLKRPETITALKYSKNHWDSEMLKMLPELAEEDIAYARMRGIYLLKSGKFLEASDVFKKISSMPSSDGRDYLNLGFALFFSGFQDEALKAFKKAAEVSPGYAPAHYNLSQYYYIKADVSDAENELSLAKQFDSQKVSEFTAIFNKNDPLRSLMIDDDVGFSAYRYLSAEVKKALQASIASGGFLFSASGVLIAVSILLAVGYLRFKKFFPTFAPVNSCSSCGEPFCSVCLEVGSESEGFCNACYLMIVKKSLRDVDEKRKQEMKIQRHRRYTAFAGSFPLLLIPPLTHLFFLKKTRVFIWLTLLLTVALTFYFMPHYNTSFVPYGLPITPGQVLAVLLAIILYVIILIDAKMIRG